MPVKVGSIVEGEVKGIASFGAFIHLSEGETGLVHISEVSDEYVSDITNHLKEGQKVKVKVLSVENGKISLSIKQAKPKRNPRQPAEIDFQSGNDRKQKFMSFEDKLSTFIKDSNERQEKLRSRDTKRNKRSR